ncbi:MAG: methyltransferase [Gemmatimonadota bacterium]|nr:methyltransferase [Gemmatimonadota bacterium]
MAGEVAAEWARTRPRGAAPTADATVLVLGDLSPRLADALEDLGHTVTRWHRLPSPNQLHTPWPPPGRCGEVWVRMPRSSLEAAMLLHAAAARVDDGRRTHLYGANNEGIRSAARHFPDGSDEPRAALIKRRCRVLTAVRSAPPPHPDGLDNWKFSAPVDWGTGERPWTFYPGVFAYGRLDPATALLIEALPEIPAGSRVLDFGAGTGPIGAAVLERGGRDTEVHLLEPDAVSLAAAAANVPGATLRAASDLSDVPGRFDLIVTNPPIHVGSAQSLRTVEALAQAAPAALAKGGSLLLVAQRRLPLARVLGDSFGDVRPLVDKGQFRVWRATTGRQSTRQPSAEPRRPRGRAVSARRGQSSRLRR